MKQQAHSLKFIWFAAEFSNLASYNIIVNCNCGDRIW